MKKIVGLLALIIGMLLFNVTAYASDSNRIWVGDSRSVGLSMNVKSNDKYIAKTGMGYDWFIKTALKELSKKLDKNPDQTVIINMGINDCTNYWLGGEDKVFKYVEKVNEFIEKYPDTKFYYLSVNPVNKNYPSKYSKTGYIDKDELNDIIIEFNDTIKSECNAVYLDSNTYLIENGFNTVDGIHYDKDTYVDIYDYVVTNV